MFRRVALVSRSELIIGLVLVYPLWGVVFIPQCYLGIVRGNPYVIGTSYLGKVTLRLVIIRGIQYTPYTGAVIPCGSNIT